MKDREIENMLQWNIENEYRNKGYSVICGVDEAGRGPLAGPVYAAACILPFGYVMPKLDDSKKLSEKTREKLYDEIITAASSYAIASASVEEIDELNILNAAQLAMRRAIESLAIKPDAALVDGNAARNFPVDAFPIIKGDGKSPSIAAASILAKVTRDRYCIELDKLYPQYGFAKHKGYPTKEHRTNIEEFGMSPVHRKTFVCKK